MPNENESEKGVTFTHFVEQLAANACNHRCMLALQGFTNLVIFHQIGECMRGTRSR
jgi:hypothetical protein